MLAAQQLRTVGAVRRAGATKVALPTRPAVRPVVLPAQRITVTRSYQGGEGGVDPEVQAKIDEFQAKLNKWWDNVDDKPSFFLYCGVAVFALTVANQFLNAVDHLPLVPLLLKLVGLVYSSWFTYKYLLFAEGRAALGKDFDKLKEGIVGQVKSSQSSSRSADRDMSSAASSLKAKASDSANDFSRTFNRN